MPVCTNCLKAVFWTDQRCPHCGLIFFHGTLRGQTDLLKPSDSGWGFSSGTLRSSAFRLAMLLLPAWLPLLLALYFGPRPPEHSIAVAIALAFFIFIPGLYVIANTKTLGVLARVASCLVYVPIAELVCYGVLRMVSDLWR